MIDWEALAKAKMHPVQINALKLMEVGQVSPAQIARTLEVPVPTASYHVRTLAEEGFCEVVDTRPVRGSIEHFHRLTEKALK